MFVYWDAARHPTKLQLNEDPTKWGRVFCYETNGVGCFAARHHKIACSALRHPVWFFFVHLIWVPHCFGRGGREFANLFKASVLIFTVDWFLCERWKGSVNLSRCKVKRKQVTNKDSSHIIKNRVRTEMQRVTLERRHDFHPTHHNFPKHAFSLF